MLSATTFEAPFTTRTKMYEHEAALDNRVRMSGSVAEAAALDRVTGDHQPEDAEAERRVVVLLGDYHHHRAHLQRQAQQKGLVALAGVPAAAAPETRLHRPLVRRCADRSQMGDHRRPLRTQVSKTLVPPFLPKLSFFRSRRSFSPKKTNSFAPNFLLDSSNRDSVLLIWISKVNRTRSVFLFLFSIFLFFLFFFFDTFNSSSSKANTFIFQRIV